MDAWHEAQIARVQKELDKAFGIDRKIWMNVMQVYVHTASCTKNHRSNALSGLKKSGLNETEITQYCDSDDLKG